MATTIESLRKLGLKVNGSEPTNNNIGNVINEIADDYTGGGSGSAGVSSIGGVDGAITLGTGLSMSGQELQVSASGGGLSVYEITVPCSLHMVGPDNDEFNIEQASSFTCPSTVLTAIKANPVGILKLNAQVVDMEGSDPVSMTFCLYYNMTWDYNGPQYVYGMSGYSTMTSLDTYTGSVIIADSDGDTLVNLLISSSIMYKYLHGYLTPGN